MEITARRDTRGAQRTRGDAAPSLLPAPSLPNGAGAIRGIGEKFSANPVTGTASFTIPIYTSPERSRFSPKLSLLTTPVAGRGKGDIFLCSLVSLCPATTNEMTMDVGKAASHSTLPNVERTDPNLRSVDLDGDGFPDILVTEHDALVWYPFLGRKVLVNRNPYLTKPFDEDKGPDLVFADSAASIFLAAARRACNAANPNGPQLPVMLEHSRQRKPPKK